MTDSSSKNATNPCIRFHSFLLYQKRFVLVDVEPTDRALFVVNEPLVDAIHVKDVGAAQVSHLFASLEIV